MSTLHIACQARRDYVPHSAAMLHSVLVNAGMPDVHVHYLHGNDLPPEYPRLLTEMVERLGGTIDFDTIPDERVKGLAFSEQFPPSHWYRLFLPELLPDLDRLLYLDADLIVRQPLRELWEMDLGDNYLGAVTNIFQDDHFGRIPQLGLDDPNVYFNSGVMLLNLAQWRKDNATEMVLEWAVANHEKLDWPEQDALNVVLGHRRLYLHPRWNLMNSLLLFPWSMHAFGAKALEEARADHAIRHFEGPFWMKPWHLLSEAESRRLYMEHRSQTPWPRMRPVGVTPANVARRAARSLRWRLRP